MKHVKLLADVYERPGDPKSLRRVSEGAITVSDAIARLWLGAGVAEDAPQRVRKASKAKPVAAVAEPAGEPVQANG